MIDRTGASPLWQRKWSSVGLLIVSVVFAMSVWFSAVAILPILTRVYNLSAGWGALAASSVALGFVCGTILSAALGLADRLDPRHFFMGCCLIAALANVAMIWVHPTSSLTFVLRFIAGAVMAGVYPVGMKLASSWADGDRGLLVGGLVGAGTLGSASPHLLGAFAFESWENVLLISSGLAVTAAVLINFVAIGPGYGQAPKFKACYALKAFTNPALRLANIGYFGHMWELYAMWSWLGVFLAASFEVSSNGQDMQFASKLATFLAIGAGTAGCIFAGRLADIFGRTLVTSWAMVISGCLSVLVGLFFGANPYLLTGICIVWGIAAVADSAQFSASVMELSDPDIVGTMVTVQTSIGFLITIITIQLTPYMVDLLGWRYGFAYLALGPLVGTIAMLKLRTLPEAEKLAGGLR